MRDVDMLLRHGGNPNEVVPEHSVSPMHLAAGLGIKPICLLLQHGGDPNIRLPDGTTPLHVASMWGDSDCVQVLLSNGGDPFIRDQTKLDTSEKNLCLVVSNTVPYQDGFSAMDFARQYKHREVTDIIKKYMYLLMTSDEPTITPKYTYTRKSMCSNTSSPSLSEPNGYIEDTSLDKYLQDFTRVRNTSSSESNDQVKETILNTYLQEFTRRRQSSIYLHSLQQQMNRCFSEGKKTHVMDVTSPDHPYIEPKNFERSPFFDGSDHEESLHLHLSLSSNEESICTDSASFVTCDGEDLDTVIKMSSRTEEVSDLSTPKTVLKQPYTSLKDPKFVKSERKKKYCRRLPVVVPDTQDLYDNRDIETCEYCGCEIINRAADKGNVCLACERLGIELEELSLNSSKNDHIQLSFTPKMEKIVSDENDNNSIDVLNRGTYLRPSKLLVTSQQSAKMYSFSSGTQFNSCLNDQMDLNRGFIQSHVSDESIISQDISYVETKIQKAEFHPSDISTITVSDDSQNYGFIISRSKNMDTSNNATLKYQSRKDAELKMNNNIENGQKKVEKDKQKLKNVNPDVRDSNEPKSCSPELDDLWSEVRASAMKAKRERDTKKILDTAFIGRESMTSGVSDASTIDYIYTDKENGIILLERHLPSQCGSTGSRRSLDSLFSTNNSPKDVKASLDTSCSSQNTISYNWKEDAMIKSADDSGKGDSLPNSETISEDLLKLNEDEIRSKLKKYWDDPGPITPNTKQMYLKRLSSLQKDPNPNAKWITKTGPEYPPELVQALCGNLDLTEIPAVETKMVEAFQNPNRLRRWREGTMKSSFNYLLLDPRITDNLPNRSNNMDDLEIFNTFITSIFYVGKGKRARPYCHLYEAIKHMKNPKDKVSRKVQQIIDIWSNGLGVVSLHCFQSVIPVEAYTREACMVEAIGLKNLTNMKRGDYYGVSTTYSMKQRRRVGVYLLTKALKIFLAEGERQISPLDLKKDP